MKKKVLLMALIAGVLFVIACKKDGKTQTAGDAFAGSETVVSSSIVNPGYALVINTGFYVLDGEDDGEKTTKTKWAASLSLGERLVTGNIREMTFRGDGKVYSFLEVRRDNGNEGYTLTTQVAVGGRLAVVVDEKTYLYRTASLVDATGTVLSRKTVVVYYPETQKEGFVEVKGYDTVRKAYVSTNISFIRLNTLSTSNSDIQSAILLQTALSLDVTQSAQQERKAVLLDSALTTFSDSVFYMDILEEANPNTSGVIDAKTEPRYEADLEF
ncbi:MAG: hypothetical protein LBI28_09710 [Treponema sp.]|jgi:hypothetical protein|nr:hypothetical protein [Treponema sp.]